MAYRAHITQAQSWEWSKLHRRKDNLFMCKIIIYLYQALVKRCHFELRLNQEITWVRTQHWRTILSLILDSALKDDSVLCHVSQHAAPYGKIILCSVAMS
jgi:hypothetical protein